MGLGTGTSTDQGVDRSARTEEIQTKAVTDAACKHSMGDAHELRLTMG